MSNGIALSQEEGWTWVHGTPKWHYFRDGRSLCKRWMLLAKPELEIGNDESFDNCRDCRNRLKKEAKAEGRAQ